MAYAVGVLAVVTAVAVLVVVLWLPVRRLRQGTRDSAAQRSADRRHGDRTPPFGELPPMGPVGPVGRLSPDADISSSGTDEHDLYGE